MKAAVLHAVGDLRIDEIAKPVPGPGEVLVRIKSCGICGSDVPRVFTKGTYKFPTVVGHEFAGVTASASDLPEGTPVTVFPLLWCGKCRECERGEYARCHDYGYLGSRSDGGFAEWVVAPRKNLLPLPAGVSLDEGAMTEPAAVALHAMRRAQLRPGETVAVFGAGPIGLLVAQWARALGAARVVIFDVAAPSLDLARRLGFTEAHNSKTADITAIIGPNGADVTVEAAGVPATFIAAVANAAAGGRVMMLGNPSADINLPAKLVSQAMRRELSLVGTWNSSFSASGLPDDWRTVLAAVAAGTLNLKPLITHTFPLDRTMDGMNVMKDRKEFVAKVLVNP
jgi:L-iditol 2-dehydrogenase